MACEISELLNLITLDVAVPPLFLIALKRLNDQTHVEN